VILVSLGDHYLKRISKEENLTLVKEIEENMHQLNLHGKISFSEASRRKAKVIKDFRKILRPLERKLRKEPIFDMIKEEKLLAKKSVKNIIFNYDGSKIN